MDETLDSWLVRLESLHPEEIELGLNRVSTVYHRLHLKSCLPRVVTVGGTNGKGSTVAMIEQIAIAHGCSIGSYTSPHLLTYNERVRLNGKPVTDEVLVGAFERIEQARGDIELTYFEYGTLASLVIFADSELDLVALEVGLGGRLDAVNIVDSDVAIVTSIAIDHTDWLGDNRNAIAFEKAGITRSAKPFICGEPDVPSTLTEHVEKVGAVPFYYGADFGLREKEAGSGEYYFRDSQGHKVSIGQSQVPALHQGNLACAMQACSLLLSDFDASKAETAATKTVVFGRQQWVSPNNKIDSEILVDVGHNPHAAESLALLLQDQKQHKKIYCLISMMSDKDIDGVIDVLGSKVDGWLVSDLPGVGRAAKASDIEEKLLSRSFPVIGCFDEPALALSQYLGQTEDARKSMLVVFGSFFTASAALEYLK